MTTTHYALKVPHNKAEPLRQSLQKKDLLDTHLKIKKDTTHIYLPLTKKITHPNFPTIQTDFESYQKKPKDYKELLTTIPTQLQSLLPTSYDIVGELLLIKIPEELGAYKNEIGKALLAAHQNITSIYHIQAIQGEFRTRTLELLAGKPQTTTTHSEYNLSFTLDPSAVYFNPRLASERHHIANLVKSGETIIDLFTGIAPFPIHIAKTQPTTTIIALDKNPEAINYAQHNIKANKTDKHITLHVCDAHDAPQIFKTTKADRIIMNLPFHSTEFLNEAFQLSKKDVIIHLYSMVQEEHLEEIKENIKTITEKNNYTITDICIRNIKTYSPHEFYTCFDITAKKRMPT